MGRDDSTDVSPSQETNRNGAAAPTVVDFVDVSAASQFDLLGDCRGIASVDWDHDGDLDFWLSSRTAPGVHLLKNGLQTRNRWVAVKLEGTSCNRDGIGARVEAELRQADAHRKLIRSVRAGDAFMSQSSKWVHFGLNEGEQLTRLTVRWPGGRTAESFSIPALEQRYRLVQGSGKAIQVATHPERTASLVAQAAKAASPPLHSRVVLTRRRELQPVTYVDFSGSQRSLKAALPGPLLVTLWASWCPNCLNELRHLDRHRYKFAEAGVKVIALSVDGVDDGDGPNDPLQASAHVRDSGFALPAGVVAEGALQSLQQLLVNTFYRERPFQVPASFLLDENGYVSIIYRGETAVETILADAKLLSSNDPQRIEKELYPLGGRSALGILPIDRLGFALAYYEGGYYEDSRRDARQFIEKTLRKHKNSLDGDQRRKLAEAYHHLGRTEEALGNVPPAIQAYRNALRLFPGALGSRISLATALMEQGEVDEAERELKRAESLGAKDAKTYFSLARWRKQFGQTERAIAYYRKALELAPRDTMTQLELAVALEANSQSGLAIEHYRQLLSKQPKLLPAANNLAWIHATSPQGEHRDGQEAFRLAQLICEATDFQQPEYLDTLAAALAELGQFEEAVRQGERALELAKKRKNNPLESDIASRVLSYKGRKPFRSWKSARSDRP